MLGKMNPPEFRELSMPVWEATRNRIEEELGVLNPSMHDSSVRSLTTVLTETGLEVSDYNMVGAY
jgi:hypothetical protein